MLVSDFDYSLPKELIAQQSPVQRGASRMLSLSRTTGAWADHLFAELPGFLRPGDLLVVNDTRVLPARLFAVRTGLHTQAGSPAPSGVVEVLLTERLAQQKGHNEWRALVRPAKKVLPGETLLFSSLQTLSAAGPGASGEFSQSLVTHPETDLAAPPVPGRNSLRATVIAAGEFGQRTLRFDPTPDFHATLERIGFLPLPPYIRRTIDAPNSAEDRARYQTIFSAPFVTGAAIRDHHGGAESALHAEQPNGSAAAPTAGLHFTPEIMAQLEAGGVELCRVTLHVGLGTFQPVRVERTEDIRLHAEPYTLATEGADALNRAYREGRRIVAVGTTVTRTLEHLARSFEAANGPLDPHGNPLALQAQSGSTALFLSPGLDDRFRLVGGLLTNFHLPQSTLLMLVSAFAGVERVRRAYAHAVAARYRFFSYGDCMLIS